MIWAIQQYFNQPINWYLSVQRFNLFQPFCNISHFYNLSHVCNYSNIYVSFRQFQPFPHGVPKSSILEKHWTQNDFLVFSTMYIIKKLFQSLLFISYSVNMIGTLFQNLQFLNGIKHELFDHFLPVESVGIQYWQDFYLPDTSLPK